jgi:transposase
MSDGKGCLPFWEGFHVVDLRVGPELIEITLGADPAKPLRCSGCQRAGLPVHERCRRRIRDLPMLGRAVLLHVAQRRVACPDCGSRMEAVPWLDRHARLTRRMADAASAMCTRLPTAHVAELFGLHWSTVRALDRQRLEAAVATLPPSRPTRLVMDEFALYKGHRYASVVLDADTRRVLWIGEGRSRAAVRPFFQALGPEGCARIEAVAMDMNTAFDLEVRRHCRNARVVYDLFHVVAKYGREVMGRVRVDAANQLRHDQPARCVVKRAHWLLLRNRANLTTPAQRVRLDEVLQANRSLMTVYVMKEQLKALWTAPGAWAWRRAWTQWMSHANESRIPALIQFARRLRGYWRGIVSRVRWPMHTGQLEGINNKIKVIKRMAYGYRDSDYFFLKIKAAFPGNP